MYDGMSCGMIALKELGCKVVKYTAYEIDKYAIQTSMANFPEIIQKGDAFAVVNL
jgi:DNA (cytosine-5)-methyltransferase 3A